MRVLQNREAPFFLSQYKKLAISQLIDSINSTDDVFEWMESAEDGDASSIIFSRCGERCL